MYEIISGNIAEGVRYQVTGTGAIIYNSITVNVGEYFIGVVSITTYTVDSGTPFVTESSIYIGHSVAFENDFYLGLFNDESTIKGISINYSTDDTFNKSMIKKGNRIIVNNDKILKTSYYGEPISDAFISITSDQTVLQTIGITLYLTGDAINIDWGDESAEETFEHDTKLYHDYSTPGIYTIKIYGDIENITRIYADDCNIINMTLNSITVLSVLGLGYNELVNLDLRSIKVKSTISLRNISTLTTVLLAPFGNELVTSLDIRYCNISNLNFSDTPVGGIFLVNDNSNLNEVIFAPVGNSLLTTLNISFCNLSNLDLSNNPVSNTVYLNSNPNLDNVIFATSGNGSLVNFRMYDCNIPNIDFSVFGSSDNIDIWLYGNSFTATEHDNQLINLDNTGWINGTLQIETGNAARTSASDTAYNNLIANGWTIT